MVFIDRLISDGYNVYSDRRIKMMDNIKGKLALNIEEQLKKRIEILKYPNRLRQERKKAEKLKA